VVQGRWLVALPVLGCAQRCPSGLAAAALARVLLAGLEGEAKVEAAVGVAVGVAAGGGMWGVGVGVGDGLGGLRGRVPHHTHTHTHIVGRTAPLQDPLCMRLATIALDESLSKLVREVHMWATGTLRGPPIQLLKDLRKMLKMQGSVQMPLSVAAVDDCADAITTALAAERKRMVEAAAATQAVAAAKREADAAATQAAVAEAARDEVAAVAAAAAAAARTALVRGQAEEAERESAAEVIAERARAEAAMEEADGVAFSQASQPPYTDEVGKGRLIGGLTHEPVCRGSMGRGGG
jgi:hypothetical protein